MSHILLSVVIPAYNEKERIGGTLADLKRYFSKRDITHEVIVVDDGSSDGTAEVVREFARGFHTLSVIENKENRGKGHAVKCGMLAAKGTYRLFMDADNSVTIDAIEPFIEEMYRGGHDVTIGSIAFRYMPPVEHNGWHRRFFGSISKFLIRTVATPGIYDTQRGFKLFSKKSAETIFPLQRIERFGFDIEILAIAQLHGFSVKELPVHWDNPEGSKVKFRAYFDSFIELARIYANMLEGRYDPQGHRGFRRRKTGVALLFIIEFPSLVLRFAREVLASNINLDIWTFDRKTEKKKGRGFIYKGKEFIHYAGLAHSETALYTTIKAQKVFFLLLATAIVSAILVDYRATIIALTAAAALAYLTDLAFHSYLIARSLRAKPALRSSQNERSLPADRELPFYTVLCPLYKEWHVTPQFLAAFEELNYPPDKLEILLLLEENDERTKRNVDSLLLPGHFKKLTVPTANPQTKARAINYGLEKAQGEYLVVYGAGDVPEPDQLRKALFAFKRSESKTISVQAKVEPYSLDKGILTKIFTAEHSLWFDLTLPGLQSLQAPLPLAGTSNHFRTEALRDLGGWDAFNVSEDWDLGIRLAKKGYRTAMLDSTTLEEADQNIASWHAQRSRWVKGYIQTYLVHMRDPQSFHGGLKDFLVFQIVVGGKVFSLLVNPIFWFLAAAYVFLKFHLDLPFDGFFPPLAVQIGAFTFAFGNLMYLLTHLVTCTKPTLYRLSGYAFIIPFYRLGMSVAAWKAVVDIVLYPRPEQKTAPKIRKNEKSRVARASETSPVFDLS